MAPGEDGPDSVNLVAVAASRHWLRCMSGVGMSFPTLSVRLGDSPRRRFDVSEDGRDPAAERTAGDVEVGHADVVEVVFDGVGEGGRGGFDVAG